MRLKSIFVILKGNKQTNSEWVKSWENDKEYVRIMQEEYKDNDPSGIALKMIEPNSTVLSAGCGPGREVSYLINKRNCKVIGIDNSEKMINLSKVNEPRGEYHYIDIEKYKNPRQFDYIVCLNNTINCLNGYEPRKEFIENCYKNLKKNGSVIITSSNALSHTGAFLRRLLTNKDFFYFPNQIKEWFSDTGFKFSKIKLDDNLLIIATKS
ncbi:class I SAM-dependent methyltransferase [Candidatus Dojkabacteria bacterium]|jgi:SAM-dependent methyltransferase|nr:class I SAM-dependent methyltransferase [Candidatus Dojkabacteria bacterium]